MKKINKIFTFILLYLGISFTVYSQVSVTPLRFGTNTSYQTFNNARVAANSTFINLPFIEEFEDSKVLNQSNWISNNNFYIDTLGFINLGSHTLVLDRYDSSFTSYSSGYGDSLISKPINLSINDKFTYLSFYWQAGGKYDAPDSTKTDSLVVSFLTPNSKKWVNSIVIKSANKMLNSSKFASVKIADTLLYSGFQFKFQSFGNSSSIEQDAWNIDFIIIDKNRTVDDSIYNESIYFTDDFTSNNGKLNLSKWESYEGVDINNSKAIDPPSKNVLTFDGIDSKGVPYSFDKPYSYGPCDAIVSKPIKINRYFPRDSVFFKFYWQAGGIVELPDSVQTDSLTLFFKNQSTSLWKKAWTFTPTKDSIDPTKFHLVKIYIPDSLYFKIIKSKINKQVDSIIVRPDFQFKFQSFGNQSGAWDNWHLDFINIGNSKITYDDVSINTSYKSLLKNYTAITLDQLQGFENEEILDTISVKLPNITGDQQNVTFQSKLINNYILKSNLELINQFIDTTANNSELTIKIAIDKTKFSNLTDSCNLNSVNLIKNGIPGSIYSNDTIAITSLVRNYLAYDDGSAEGAFGINQAAGRVLYKIKLNRPDTISAVDFSWVQSVYNLNGTTFKLLVLKNLDSVSFSKQVSLIYSDDVNPFTRYKIQNKTVLVSGRIDVGYQQIGSNSKALRIGFDKNTNSQQQYWCDNDQGGGWTQLRNLPGSIMIHPVFANGALNISPRLGGEEGYDLKISPNPNFGNLNLHEIHDRVIIYNASGQVVMNAENVNELNLTGLQRGFYIVKTYLNGYHSVKKLDYRGN